MTERKNKIIYTIGDKKKSDRWTHFNFNDFSLLTYTLVS